MMLELELSFGLSVERRRWVCERDEERGVALDCFL
jgi:hypothetical protein